MAIGAANSNGTTEPTLGDQTVQMTGTDETIMLEIEEGLRSLIDRSQVSEASGVDDLRGTIGWAAYRCIAALFKTEFSPEGQSLIVQRTRETNAHELVTRVATNVATAVFTLLTNGLTKVTRVSVERVEKEVANLAGLALEQYIRVQSNIGEKGVAPPKG